ncbi:MAG: ferredoxin:protochlorophyllide reductase (ATP-dependent) subunit B [Chloroflexota bacterium]
MRLAYWMYEGTAHHGVGRIANSMQGVHAVFHAPQGDDYVNPIFTMLERTPTFPQMTTSVVSGRDLAMGTIRLPDTLRQVEERLHPELILVCASCSTILLQENLQNVADNAGVDAEVIVYDANPYRMQEIVAAERLFTLLVERFAAAQDKTSQPSVNIIGPASLGFHVRQDMIALRRMMQALGVKINVVAPLGASVQNLRDLPKAWVNIAPYRELGLGAAQHLESTFGMPTIYDAPIGVQPTLKWLNTLVDTLNAVGVHMGHSPIEMPPLTAFSLDGMSAPSGVPWFARTADMESFSSKRAFVFGDATHTVGMVKFLKDELAMPVVGAGTYLEHEADWVREQLDGYIAPDDLLVTEQFQDVAARIEALQPDLVCGTQMERHSSRKLDLSCMVIAPPTHIENHLLGYTPILGFSGADYLADKVYTSTKLGLEKHLIDMFGDAGLEYEDGIPSEEQMEQLQSEGSIEWGQDAEKILRRVPFFVRGRVRRNTEQYAADNGHQTVTADVLQAAREALGG